MGLCARSTNVLFHTETGDNGPTNSDWLAHCIADINTTRKPDLFIVDSTVFIINNGPFGPGELLEEHKIIAGTDPVAIDAYCSRFLDYDEDEVLSIQYAAELNVGEPNLARLFIEEKTLG